MSVMEKARAEILEPLKTEINELRAQGHDLKADRLEGGATNLYGKNMDYLFFSPQKHEAPTSLSKRTEYYKLDQGTEELLQKEKEFYDQHSSVNMDKAIQGGQRYV